MHVRAYTYRSEFTGCVCEDELTMERARRRNYNANVGETSCVPLSVESDNSLVLLFAVHVRNRTHGPASGSVVGFST